MPAGPGGTVYVRDVAQVRDGYAPQTNVVRRDGKRAALLEIEKSGNTSTLSIIAQVKAMLPRIMAGPPPSLRVQPVSDQSVFVTSAIHGVLHEALIAACLTAAMILLFLGSWRATLIIAISIPLSVLAAPMTLSALGETLDIMTLGVLESTALASERAAEAVHRRQLVASVMLVKALGGGWQP